LQVPSGSIGVVLRHAVGNVQSAIICWQNVFTGWIYLVRQLEVFLKPRNGETANQESVNRVATILALISRLLNENEKIAAALPKYMQVFDCSLLVSSLPFLVSSLFSSRLVSSSSPLFYVLFSSSRLFLFSSRLFLFSLGWR
jgi:hypothetical protein